MLASRHTVRSTRASGANEVPVWDPFVRLFHWTLVAAVATAAATGFFGDATLAGVHLMAGLVVAALVAVRLAWGVLGPTYARFTSFVRRPSEVLAYLRAARAGSTPRYVGHNPLGGLMVVALIAAVAALTATGLVALGGVLKSGPLAFATSFTVGEGALELHELLAFALLGLVALHLGGVVLDGVRHRESLVRAMVTGRKARHADDVTARSRHARPLAASATVLGLAVATVAGWLALDARPGLGVPTAPLDPLYAEECGACHQAYHPNLLPRASWSAMMADLSDHFGEDAWLPPATVADIGAYLDANAAEAFDTKAAHRLRRVDPDAPLAITATPFWRRTHRDIPDDVFARAPIASAGNCAACHGDARQGTFRPFAIDIPQPESSS